MGNSTSKPLEFGAAAAAIYGCHRYVKYAIDDTATKIMADRKASKASMSKSSSSNKLGLTKRSASYAKLQHAVSEERAVELDRYHPTSFTEVFKNFCHSWVVCFVLDMLFARRMKARWFALHSLVGNSCV